MIAKSLIDENDQDTPVLSSIRLMYSKGITIGGTSAGATIMSKTMIHGHHL